MLIVWVGFDIVKIDMSPNGLSGWLIVQTVNFCGALQSDYPSISDLSNRELVVVFCLCYGGGCVVILSYISWHWTDGGWKTDHL